MKLKGITASKQYIKEKNDIYCFLADEIIITNNFILLIIINIKQGYDK